MNFFALVFSNQNDPDEKRVVRKRSTRTETSNTETQTGSVARDLQDRPLRKKKKPEAPPPPQEEDGEDNEGEKGQESQEQPTNLTDAVKNLGTTTVTELKNRGTDFVNGSTGLVRSGSRKVKALGDFAGQQLKNAEEVTIEGIKMASEAGDGLKRGTKHVMNSTRDIAKEGGNQAHQGLVATTELAKSATKVAGTMFNTPVYVAGNWLGVGNNALNLPRRFSRSASAQINKKVFRVDEDQENVDEGNKEEEEPKPKVRRKSAK